jgi:hypothetical protein
MRRIALMLVVLSACVAPELRPGPGTMRADGRNTAVATESGVTFVVDGGAWSGFPRPLETVVPVRVTIHNDSGRPLRIRYPEMALIGPGQARFAALPPFQIRTTEMVSGVGGAGYYDPLVPRFYWRGFVVPSRYHPFYSGYYGLDPYWGPWAYDDWYFGRYYTQWPVTLPTRDMLERALPEGVLRPGGRVSGFVYFQNVPDPIDRVVFKADLVDAETGEQFGTIEIPFYAENA